MFDVAALVEFLPQIAYDVTDSADLAVFVESVENHFGIAIFRAETRKNRPRGRAGLTVFNASVGHKPRNYHCVFGRVQAVLVFELVTTAAIMSAAVAKSVPPAEAMFIIGFNVAMILSVDQPVIAM